MNTLKILFFVLVLALCLSNTAFAQFEEAVWDTLTADTLQDALTSQAIGVNGYEEFHLTYAKARPSGSWNIYYRYFSLYNGMDQEVLAESNIPCNVPVIASRFGDNDYDIAIIFESGEDMWGCINHGPHEPWSFVNVTHSSDPDFTPTVAFSASYMHAAWITYTNSEYKICYLRIREETMLHDTLFESQLGPYGSGAKPFIIAPLDTPHIFYRGVSGDNYGIHHAYKPNPDSSWVIEYLSTPNLDDYSASADIDILCNIYVAISGNEGWGMPAHVYSMKLDHDTHQWSTPQLVTGLYSATNASIMTLATGKSFVASCGVSGNVYNGNVYLSCDTIGSFQTQLLASYPWVTQPAIGKINGEHAVIVFDAPIGSEENRNVELVYYGPQMMTSIDSQPKPVMTGLSSCYPNPFNSRTNIQFEITQPGEVSLEIYDLLGRKVSSLLNEILSAGCYNINWNAIDRPSGVYFYRISAGDNGRDEEDGALEVII